MEDLSGYVFNRWKVIAYAGYRKWRCVCECGNKRNVSRNSLIGGQSKSCGCFKSPSEDEYNIRTRDRLKRKMIISNNGCWNWSGFKFKSGYGQTNYRKKQMRAYRAAWILWKGEIPKGIYVLHKCDNRGCINPDHLFLGTHKDNMRDMKLKGRACRGENSHLSKLSKNEVNSIRNEYAIVNITEIGLRKKYSLSRCCIHGILYRNTWKHI